ncbi:hypothetical protein KIN20_010270 [Parelaphostrongylus tenuis]|uniref:Uncharacterized protein n=1 Tax=Parelaphostrongylus tenuis TaxID=148309 RepID=A0AAD5M7M8_PARTN|nr:hypothetical protein KIN20_010270 [Parelaphostrongylus tenuis]
MVLILAIVMWFDLGYLLICRKYLRQTRNSYKMNHWTLYSTILKFAHLSSKYHASFQLPYVSTTITVATPRGSHVVLLSRASQMVGKVISAFVGELEREMFSGDSKMSDHFRLNNARGECMNYLTATLKALGKRIILH